MDYLFRGLARNDKIRILATDAKESISNICKAHQTLPLTTVAFARFLLAGALIGALEKDSHGITMQINSDGAAGSFFVQATPNGSLRGYVSNPQGELNLEDNDLCIESVVGRNGILSVSKIFDEDKEFTSDVILTAGDISKDIAYYFFTSEQIPTIVDLQVNLDGDGGIKDAKGYLIQLITGYDEDDVHFLENIELKNIENLDDTINSMFNDFKKLDTIEIRDVCDCSKERFLNSLSTLPISDLEDLGKENVEIVCHFCAKKYIVTPDEIKELINRK